MPQHVGVESLYRLCLRFVALNVSYWTDHYERHVLKRTSKERQRILFVLGPFDELGSWIANDLLDMLSLERRLCYPSLQLILNGGVVTKLNLEGAAKTVNDAVVHSITKHCSQLRHLNLENCKRVSASALLALSEKLPLALSLNFSGTAINTSAICNLLQNSSRLLELILKSCKISDKTFLEIDRVRNDGTVFKLRCLDLSDSFGVTEKGLMVLFRIAPDLRELHHHLLFDALSTTASLPTNPLAARPGHLLRCISCLDAESLEDYHIELLVLTCPGIERLELRFTSELARQGLHTLSSLRYLQVLVLDGNYQGSHMDGFAPYNSRVKPVLEGCGKGLRTLTLENIEKLDLVEVATLCPNLVNLTVLQHGEPGGFRDGCPQRVIQCPSLSKLCIWSRIGDTSLQEGTLARVLLSAVKIDQLQLFQVDSFTDSVLQRLIAEDTLKVLTSIDLQECNHITGLALSGVLLDKSNLLHSVRLIDNWNVHRSDYDKWRSWMKKVNLDVKLDWE